MSTGRHTEVADQDAREPGLGASPTAACPEMGHAFDAVERYFFRSSVRFERVVATVRLSLCGVAFARNIATYAGDLRAGNPKYWIGLCVLLFGIAFSIWTLRTLTPASRHLPTRLRVSVLVDAVVMAGILLPMTIWPWHGYTSLLLNTELYFVLICMLGAGLRLSTSAARYGTVANLTLVVVALGYEYSVHPPSTAHTLPNAVLITILFAGAAAVALAVASQSRRLVLEGAQAALEAQRARQRLGVYLSEAVADAAMSSDQLELGGHMQHVAVLFSDLRGFTAYSENLPPDQLVSEVNQYLDVMVREVEAAGGVVDKFIGDSVMAVFGAPVSTGDEAACAVQCAAAMQEALARLNRDRARAGRPPLSHGVGVHAGTVIAGNIGNAGRLQYTVLGDVVNLASRLESATKDVGVPVLISAAAVDEARARVGDAASPALSRIGPISVRGHSGTLEVYTFEPETADQIEPGGSQCAADGASADLGVARRLGGPRG